MRAGGSMQGLRRWPAARGQEAALLAAPGRDFTVTAVAVLLTAALFAAVADHGALTQIQRVDDAWLRVMVSNRSGPLTAIAMLFNVLGLVYVTLPVRIAIAVFLGWRRRWWHLAAFAAAIVSSEVLIGTLKGIYDRARPPGSLVATSGASFPSGHSVAASVTVVAAVIALVPAERRRAVWGGAAVAFSILMAFSRAYLGAHWLSDAMAGVLLGTACALLAALVAGQLQRSRAGAHDETASLPDLEQRDVNGRSGRPEPQPEPPRQGPPRPEQPRPPSADAASAQHKARSARRSRW